MGGELQLLGTTAAVIPSGAFNLIRGRLELLGKRLDLSEAVLQMEGDLVPSIHIVATTENDGITSGVTIDGPATDPAVTFTSTPELPQEEVLAQLLFGQGLQNLSALQALQLANAVATLAGRGGEGVVSKLRQGFGLDNLDVKTDAAGGASVTAGKYLTKKIYSEITVDQNGQSEIDLNLDVSKSVTLRANSGSDGNTGLGVVLEKDY
jgi:translocation and assembly module TamB